MEKNFYNDNFEQLLKESADNFRMYPSRRVWRSIYNDLHPSRKWPSLAIWLLFISSAVYIGLSNRNHQPQFNAVTGSLIGAAQREPKAISTFNNSTSKGNDLVKTNRAKKQDILHNFGDKTSPADIDTRTNPLNNMSTDQTLQSAKIIAFYKNILDDKRSSIANENDPAMSENVAKNSFIPDSKNHDLNSTDPDAVNELNKNKTITGSDPAGSKEASTRNKTALERSNINTNDFDKEWIEDFAFHNKPSDSKWKSRVSYQFYATPSIGYRTMTKNTSFTPAVSPSLVVTSNIEQDYNSAVSQAAAVNMELGGDLLYSISKKLNIKIGLQLNYTNYNINAYELKHPTMTNLLLNDLNTGLPVLSPRATTLANSEGLYSRKLNNNTYQISLPIGADIKLAGNDNLKWFAGATIQPTYIAGGNAYFISSDLKNYVTDNSLIRKWNLNGGLETFISYKTKSGIILNAGPQMRYQFLSTYSKEYSYDEKLYNFGLKIGIITRL